LPFAVRPIIIDADAVRSAIAQLGMFNIIHYDHVIKVDCIVRKDTPYRREEFARRSAVEIDGVTMWFVTAEDLLLSKLAWAAESRTYAGRPAARGAWMNDTPEVVQNLYRRLLMRRSGSERLHMGWPCSILLGLWPWSTSGRPPTLTLS
jgi:hypothetical protein